VELTTICKCNRNIALLVRSLINFISCFYSFYESLHINLVTSVKFLYSGPLVDKKSCIELLNAIASKVNVQNSISKSSSVNSKWIVYYLVYFFDGDHFLFLKYYHHFWPSVGASKANHKMTSSKFHPQSPLTTISWKTNGSVCSRDSPLRQI